MMLFALALAMAACQGVEGDVILGSDLAAADAQFAGVPAAAKLGYAAIPGSQRTLSVVDLKGIASRFSIAGEFHEVCFEYATRVLESGEILAALRASLNVKNADIQIVEFSLFPAPRGVLVFPLNSLGRPSPTRAGEPVIWRGYVQYAVNRKFAIWAKVRLQVEETRVMAVENIAAAQPVQASQLRVETVSGFPSFQAMASSVEQVAGHTLRRGVRKDSVVALDAVEGAARDVNRGETVAVESDVGMAHLKFEARAETGGAAGETVMVRNVKSGKRFAARVAGKGKVTVAQ